MTSSGVPTLAMMSSPLMIWSTLCGHGYLLLGMDADEPTLTRPDADARLHRSHVVHSLQDRLWGSRAPDRDGQIRPCVGSRLRGPIENQGEKILTEVIQTDR